MVVFVLVGLLIIIVAQNREKVHSLVPLYQLSQHLLFLKEVERLLERTDVTTIDGHLRIRSVRAGLIVELSLSEMLTKAVLEELSAKRPKQHSDPVAFLVAVSVENCSEVCHQSSLSSSSDSAKVSPREL